MNTLPPKNPATYQGALNVGSSTGSRMFVGWLQAKPGGGHQFETYSRNLSEYMACEMSMIGFVSQSYSDSKLDLLEQAHQAGMEFCLINQIGYWSSQFNHEITRYLAEYYSGQAVVGDHQNLDGITLINVQWWAHVGKPVPNSDEFHTLAQQQGVAEWPCDLILVTDLHPLSERYQVTMDRMHATTFSLNVFFCANTENLWLDQNVTDLPTNTIITVAGGLGAVLLAYASKMPAGSNIHIIDTSPFAIAMSKQIFEQWDGTDYVKFVEMLMEQHSDCLDRFRGIRQLRMAGDIVASLPGFAQWFQQVFKTHKITYTQTDLMNYSEVAQLLGSIDLTQPRQVVVNFSNVYHYAPSSFHVDYNTRRSLSVQVLKLIGELSIQGNTRFCRLGGNLISYYRLLRMFPWR